MKWTTARRRISDLIPTQNNPRQLTEKQHADLTRSLKKFNLVEIPAINQDGQILAGHQRLKVMASLGRGDEEIDVRVPDRKLTKKECEEYLIRSNKNTGEWNMDELANSFDLEELKEWGFEDVELGLTAEQKKEVREKKKEEIKRNIKIKIIYIRPEDWLNWKNKICNFLNENEIPYEILE